MTILISLAFGCAFTASVMVAHYVGGLEERCRWQKWRLDAFDTFIDDDPDPGDDIPDEDLGENVVAIGKEAA